MLKAWSPSASERDCILSRTLEVINLNSAPIQSDRGPCEKRRTHTEKQRTHNDVSNRTHGKKTRRLQATEKPTLLTPWSWASSLQNWEQINFSCLSPPVYGSPGVSDGKESACNARDLGSVPGLGRSPGEGMATHSCSCLENPMDKGAWRATVHEVTKSQTRLSD